MLAVIVKGNPKFLNTPLAKQYYKDIEVHLKKLGYTVVYDNGRAYTRPRQDADLYVAHSRGTDRFEFMTPENQQRFVMLGVPEGVIADDDKVWQDTLGQPGVSPTPPDSHFIYSDKQREAVEKMSDVAKHTLSSESRNPWVAW